MKLTNNKYRQRFVLLLVSLLSYSAVSNASMLTQPQEIQNDEAGLITQIFVHQGQRVIANQPLVQLDPTPYSIPLAAAKLKADFLQITLWRLTAEVLNKPFEIPLSWQKAFPLEVQYQQNLYNLHQANYDYLLDSVNLVNREWTSKQIVLVKNAISAAENAQLIQRRNDLNQQLSLYISNTLAELSTAKVQWQALAKDIEIEQNQLRLTTVRAPGAGTITKIDIKTQGFIPNNSTLMEFTPSAVSVGKIN